MRYECNECLEIFDEGDIITEGEESVKLCPECMSDDITKLDDSEYGN